LGKHVVHLGSKQDIRSTPSDTDDILIPRLPIADYPLLSKFTSLRQLSFYTPDGSGGTDAKLRALAAVPLPNLKDVGLLNYPAVTDGGIRALAKIPSLRSSGLEGTSITDEGCAILGNEMKLEGVNVANCTNITKIGISALAQSPTITQIGFSADSLSQGEVEQLVESFQRISWCTIVDLAGKLDEAALKAKGTRKGMTIVVMPYGALQSMKMTDEEHRELLKKRGKL
jgi:hypothetical protein